MSEDEPERPLPELHTATLDATEVIALGRDLERDAEEIRATVKGGAVQRAADETLELWDALNQLLAGDVSSAQIRYVHAGAAWIDTIMRRSTAFRVVRIEQTF